MLLQLLQRCELGLAGPTQQPGLDSTVKSFTVLLITRELSCLEVSTEDTPALLQAWMYRLTKVAKDARHRSVEGR